MVQEQLPQCQAEAGAETERSEDDELDGGEGRFGVLRREGEGWREREPYDDDDGDGDDAVSGEGGQLAPRQKAYERLPDFLQEAQERCEGEVSEFRE